MFVNSFLEFFVVAFLSFMVYFWSQYAGKTDEKREIQAAKPTFYYTHLKLVQLCDTIRVEYIKIHRLL